MTLDGLRTGDDQLDKRLRGQDFFDAAHYPIVTFKSTEVAAKAAGNEFSLTGELTIHGVTKRVTLQAKINKVDDVPGQAPWVGFDADGVLQRSEFGLSRYVPLYRRISRSTSQSKPTRKTELESNRDMSRGECGSILSALRRPCAAGMRQRRAVREAIC